MRLTCPLCGDRDRREFYYMGSDDFMTRPEEGDLDAMHAYLHLRDNPHGLGREMWQHEAGCGAWLVVTRDMSSHEITACELPGSKAAKGRGAKT